MRVGKPFERVGQRVGQGGGSGGGQGAAEEGAAGQGATGREGEGRRVCRNGSSTCRLRVGRHLLGEGAAIHGSVLVYMREKRTVA